MSEAIRFQKGSYILSINNQNYASITRCRFHWIGKLLCLLGMAQRVTVNKKSTYVYLKGNEAFMNRIRNGRGKDLAKLMLGKQKVSHASHRLLRSFYPDLSCKVKHENGGSTYTYSPLELKRKLGIEEGLSGEAFDKHLENNLPPVDESGISQLTEGCTLFVRSEGSIRCIIPSGSHDPKLSSEDVLIFRAKDRLAEQDVMVKLGITLNGIGGVENDYRARRLLGEHPGLLKIICLANTPFGTAHISPLYAKGDLVDQKLTIEEKVEGFKQLLNTLVHIHNQGLPYGDFKPENIVRNDQGEWVLIDFETVVAEYPADIQDLRCSRDFVPHEDAEAYKRATNKVEWRQRCDIAALALLMLNLSEVDLGDYPSLEVMQEEVKKAPEELQAVLKEMLNPDPTQRISAQAALEKLTASKS